MSSLIKRLSKSVYDKAQLMYFSGAEVSDICMTLSIDEDTIRFYVFGEDGDGKSKSSWYAVKKQMQPTAMAIYLKDKVAILDQTAGVAFEVLSMALGRLKREMLDDESKQLSIDEMTKLTNIQVNLDKIARLESGRATDITETIGSMTLTEAKEILNSDPFAQAIDAEYTEHSDIPWLTDNKSVDTEI